MGKPGPKPQGRISTKWSPELAYIVGLLASDGCLSKDKRHIDFTSKDKDSVVTFRRCLGIDNKIGRKVSGYTGKKNVFRVQFGDVKFYQWLEGIGLSSKKSKTLSDLEIPDRYFFDFLRGHFDGDGSMYAYWDPRWHSSYMFYLQFTSASLPFLEWLQRINSLLGGVGGTINEASNSFQLRYAKRESLILFDKMFYSNDIPYLKRKFIKARKIFKIDQNHNNLRG